MLTDKKPQLEDERKGLNGLRRELFVLQADLGEASLRFRKRFADLKVRTKQLLKTLEKKET